MLAEAFNEFDDSSSCPATSATHAIPHQHLSPSTPSPDHFTLDSISETSTSTFSGAIDRIIAIFSSNGSSNDIPTEPINSSLNTHTYRRNSTKSSSTIDIFDPTATDAGPYTLVDADIVDTSSPQSLAALRADVDATNAEYTPDPRAELLKLWVNVKPLADIQSPTLRRLAEHAQLLGMRVHTYDVALVDHRRLRTISDTVAKLAAWRRRARSP